MSLPIATATNPKASALWKWKIRQTRKRQLTRSTVKYSKTAPSSSASRALKRIARKIETAFVAASSVVKAQADTHRKLGTAELLFRGAQEMGLQPNWITPNGLFA